MADPFSWAAIGSSVISAGATIYSGMAQKSALEAQAGMARYEGQIAELRGKQISAEKRDELNRVLAAIDTMRVSRGTGLDSPTGVALRQANREQSDFARNASVLTERLNAVRAQTQAQSYAAAAPVAMWTGFAQAVPKLTSAASSFSSGFGG